MTLHQWLLSYLLVGLPVGILYAQHSAQILLTILRGKEATIYGRNAVDAKKRADLALEIVADIRKMQHVISDKAMAFIFALVLTIVCTGATFAWIYVVFNVVTRTHKMQVKETP